MERFKKVLIKSDQTIKQALKQMDAMGEKTLLVVDRCNTLLGTVTDGDIRRWILQGKHLAKSVSNVMNPDPKALSAGFEREAAKELMVKQIIECLPVLDKDRKVVSAVWWIDLFEKKEQKIKAVKAPVVIMAGGEGSRLSPFTKILPKPLIPIGDKPIIELIIERFMKYGCNDFYLSLNYKSSIIKAYFSDSGHKYNINYVLENKPLGTAGSLHLLKNKIKETFYVSNCDILIDADYADIMRFHRQRKNRITLVSSMKNFTIPYGVCEIENGGDLSSVKEKPEYDFLVSTGLYIMEPEVINDIPKGRCYQVTDLIAEYLKKGKRIGVYPISEKSWLDIGQLEEYQKNIKAFGIQ